MPRRSLAWVHRIALSCLLWAVGCSEDPHSAGAPAARDTWEDVCIDEDGDGYGFQCEPGDDCDDTDSSVFEHCNACARPSEGCACPENAEPVECSLPKELSAEGTLLCKSGTRYCRDGVWSGCEGVRTFAAPPPSRLLSNALIDVDASPVICSACSPDCYRVEDTLADPGDASLPGTNIISSVGGGITLTGADVDAGAPPSADELTPIPPCNTSLDSDCDGVPNTLDPYPLEKPFATDHTTIFMDLAPGQSDSNTFGIQFYLNTADVYFLIDMTGSMSEEKTELFNSLRSGNFLDDPSTAADESLSVTCADRDGDGVPDSDRKTGGITGNIACLIRSSGFGIGWYREVPFSASDDYGIRYSYPDFEAFEHRQDINEDDSLTSAALDLLYTRGNRNWAEAATVALSAVATGGPIYMGWDRPGIPPKICPAGRYGYPCFRDEAIPIVVLITDAPMMNGPVPAQGHLGSESSSYSYGGTYNLQPVNYQPQGLRYTSLSSDARYHPVTGNEDFASAYDVGVIDDSFLTYTGDTRGMSADIHAANLPVSCPYGTWPSNATSASSPGYPDAVFKFSVASTKTLTISTRGTRHQPTLAVVPAGLVTSSTQVASNGNNHDAASAQDLGTLSANVNLEITGDTSAAAFSTGDFPTYAMKECFRGTGGSSLAPDTVYKFQVAEDMSAVTFAADGSDFEAVLALYEDLPTSASDASITNTNDRFWQSAAALPPGSASAPGSVDGRVLWLKGGDTSSLSHDYADSFFTGTPGDSTCNNVSGDARDVVFDFTVNATRTVDIETTGSSDATSAPGFDHVIALAQRPSSSGGSLPSVASACNKNGGGTRRAVLSSTLSPGTYSLILRGEQYSSGWGGWWGSWGASDDKGPYGVIISDHAAQPLGCHNESVTGSFTTSLRAGVTYYVVMRGRHTGSGGGSGPYTLRIARGAGSGSCAYDNTTYPSHSGDYSYDPHAAEITQTFAPGDYYVVLKGNADNSNWNPKPPSTDRARGWYQLTLGDPSLALDNQIASMPVWGDTSSGVLHDLKAHNIHVINVTSTIAVSGYSGGAYNQNTALRQQADIVAQSTGATSVDGTPLRFDIRNDGRGMGFAVVDAINRLAKNLSMDVSVRFVPSPDMPTPPQQFIFQARAIDRSPGDLCLGVADADGDGVPDTHLGCRPGADPRFEVTFTNPAVTSPLSESHHVLPNGTKGGYDMRLELIGDGQYVVDTIPVYIIPQDVVMDPPTYLYDPSGTYTQDIKASGCIGTERPDWRSLQWQADIPAGTTVDFRMCVGDSVTELDACAAANSWTSLAHVYSGAACVSDSDCTNGYCSAAGLCEYAERPGCSADDECGTGGACVSGSCVWSQNPIDLKPALIAGYNGHQMARLQVELTADATRTSAPSLANMNLNYVCAPSE